MWKILLGLRVTDVPHHISYCMLEVRWFMLSSLIHSIEC